MQSKNSIKGISFIMITAIIWGGSFISQLFGGLELGSFYFTALRCIPACLTILIMIFIDNIKRTNKCIFFREEEDVRNTIASSAWCGFVLYASIITQQIGVEMTDTAKSGLIASLEVICVPILMFIFYKKKIKLITWLFIITTMIGIMMLSLNSITGINKGDIIVFISTILYSITILQVPKYIVSVDPLKFSFFRFIVVGILSYICAFVFKSKVPTFETIKNSWGCIFYSGVLSSGVAYTCQIIGQKYCEPVIATLIMSLEGIFAAIFGWIILGQALNLIQIIGIIIAFASIVLVQITDSPI